MNTIQIFRIEHKELKLGPYRMPCGHKDFIGVANRYYHNKSDHPTFEREFTASSRNWFEHRFHSHHSEYCYAENCKFGFEDLDQLFNWFYWPSIIQLFKNHNFHVVIYELSQGNYIRIKNQIMFDSNNAVLIDSMEL